MWIVIPIQYSPESGEQINFPTKLSHRIFLLLCFFRVYNVDMGAEKEQQMMTGLHKVRSIKCKQCRTSVGWTYVSKPI